MKKGKRGSTERSKQGLLPVRKQVKKHDGQGACQRNAVIFGRGLSLFNPNRHSKLGPPKVPLEAGSQNRAFSGFLSVLFLAKPVQIAPGLRQLFENLSGLWEQAYFTKSQC